MADKLTHFDAKGDAHMVDVGGKAITDRVAVARCNIKMLPQTYEIISEGRAEKGDVLGVARLAGIMAAKRTSDTIPLCHPLMIASVSISFEVGDDHVAIEAHVDCVERTGVEMEALHACSVAALTIYDMLKAADRGMTIGGIRLALKEGGKSGRFEAE